MLYLGVFLNTSTLLLKLSLNNVKRSRFHVDYLHRLLESLGVEARGNSIRDLASSPRFLYVSIGNDYRTTTEGAENPNQE